MADEFGSDWAGVISEEPPDTSSVVVDTPQQAQTFTPPVESAEQQDSNMLKDVLLHGVVGGVEQAGRGVYSTVKAGADALGADMPELGKPMVDEAEGIPAQITRDVTQFGLGFVGGMGLLKATGAAAKMAPFVKELIASGVGTGVVADPTAPRLSNLIEKYPNLANPVTEYLSQDDSDGIAESKFKAALEDVMMTPVAAVLFKTVKAMKNALKGNDAEAGKLADELAQDVKGVNAADDVIEVPETKVTPEKIYETPETAGMHPIAGSDEKGPYYFAKEEAEANADGLASKAEAKVEDVPGVEIKSASGNTVFKLSTDDAAAFDKHVEYLVSNDHLEDLFNFPAFSTFNAAHSSATPDTQEVVEALASYVKPKLDKYMHGAKQSHEEVKKFADFLGEDSNALYARMQQTVTNMADLPATITAAKGLTYSLARESRRLAIRTHNGVATAEDTAALSLANKRLTDVLGMTLAIRKGAARATSAGKITTGEKDLAGVGGEDLDELVKLLALTKDEKEAIGIFKGKSLMGKLIDAHNEVWINAILSGAKTHMVNITSAAANTLLTPINQIVGGALTMKPAEVREGFALYKGLSRHVWDSLKMAGRAFKTEQAILDPGKTTDEFIEKAISGKNFQTMGRFADWIGTAARIPGRFLKAEDEFFKQMNYRAKVEANAAREASDLVHAGKLKVEEVDKFMADKFQSAFSPQNVGLNKSAIEYSREITFTQDLNAIKTHDWFGNPGARIQQFASGHPWLRGTILPFIKVPTNLMREAGNYTPLIGAFKKEGMDVWRGVEKDPTKRAVFAGKMATGSMMWVGASMLALEGRLTGSAFGDKDMRNRQMESGWQPYSVAFDNPDGTKRYISFQRLDPYGMIFGLAADVAYLSQHIDENSRQELATAMTMALAKNLSSKSYLQGLVEWATMIGGGEASADQFERMLQMRAASYIPNITGLGVAISGDTELKEIRSTVDALMAKIPGLSSEVEAKRDYFGEKRVAPIGAPWNAINPFPASDEKDKVRVELGRLARSQSEAKFTMPDTKMGNVDLTEIRNAKGQTAYDRWTEMLGTVEMGGKTLHDKLGEVITSFRYQEGTDGTSAYHNGNRIVMIKREQEKYREKALREMLKEFDMEQGSGPKLRDQIRQDKRNVRATQRGRVDQIRDLLNLSN